MKRRAEAELLLTNVPSDTTRDDNSSWNDFYWEPFRDYLKGHSCPPTLVRLLHNRNADRLSPHCGQRWILRAVLEVELQMLVRFGITPGSDGSLGS